MAAHSIPPPLMGGTLRVGIVGGSAEDSLDAHSAVTHPDEARVLSLHDTLATYVGDAHVARCRHPGLEHNVEMALAGKVTPSQDGKTWTAHLRDGLRFSDGSPITADDVICRFQRITDPKDPKAGAAALQDLERDGLKATDAQMISFPFEASFVTFPDTVAQYATGIVPKGYDPAKPVSSGPFVLKSFTPGQQSTFVMDPNYWRGGQPYVAPVSGGRSAGSGPTSSSCARRGRRSWSRPNGPMSCSARRCDASAGVPGADQPCARAACAAARLVRTAPSM